jgi:hypothetical protein
MWHIMKNVRDDFEDIIWNIIQAWGFTFGKAFKNGCGVWAMIMKILHTCSPPDGLPLKRDTL